MKLEEAIDRLKAICKQCHNSKECWGNEFCSDCYIEVEDVFAIETFLKAYEELKKENEELKNMDLTTVYLKGVADEKERWRNKIKDLIERLNKNELLNKYNYEQMKIAIDILQDLLKEE